MTTTQTGFFSGSFVAPEVNTTDELVDLLEAQVQTVVDAKSAATAAAALAQAAATNAGISEGNTSTLSQQANDTLSAANTALVQANAAIASTAASATTATQQAQASSTSASQAATSASNAATSESNAAASASAASASQTAAATSATNSANSASAALASKNAAATSETNAAGSASAAATSKSGADASATSASNSASAASTSASNASGSASSASASATAASTSASSAAASANLCVNQTAYLAGRNRLINGDMRVQQRGSLSITAGTSGFGNCDRWKGSNSAPSGAFTLSTVNNPDINGVTKPFSIASVTSAFPASFSGGNSVIPFWQIIEGWNAYDLIGQQVTVSFIVRGNIPGTYGVSMRDSVSSYSIVKTFTLNAASTPQYVSLTFPAIPSGASIPYTGIGLSLFIGAVGGPTVSTSTYNTWQAGNLYCAASATNWLSSGSGVLNITDVQLEAGPVATPFEKRPIGQEFALCQRYYYQSDQGVVMGLANRDSTAVSAWTGPTADASSYLSAPIAFPVQMRATPSLTIYNPHTGATGQAYSQNAAASLTASQGGINPNNVTLIIVSQNVISRDFVRWHFAVSSEL